MKQNNKIKKALGLVTALFVSVPVLGQTAQTGLRASPSSKRGTGIRAMKRENPSTGKDIRANKRDASAKAIGGGGDPRRDNPFGGKARRDNPTTGIRRRANPAGGVRRREDPNGIPQKQDSGLLVK
jgi:hypothetical protein